MQMLYRRAIQDAEHSGEAHLKPILSVLYKGFSRDAPFSIDQLLYDACSIIRKRKHSLFVGALLSLGCVPWFKGIATGLHVRLAAEIAMEAALKTMSGNSDQNSDHKFDVGRLVRDTATFVLKSMASSPNFNTGGAMQFLIEELHRVQNCEVLNYSAKCCAWVRDVVAVSLGKVPPEKLLVIVQKLDLNMSETDVLEAHGKSAADELLGLLSPLPGNDKESEARSIGYVMKSIARVMHPSAKNPLLGPQIWLAPMVQNRTISQLRNVLQYVQDLPATSLEKWRTHGRIANLLKLLIETTLHDSILHSLQSHIRREVMTEGFSNLLCVLPDETSIEDSESTREIKKHIVKLRRDLKVLFPEYAAATLKD